MAGDMTNYEHRFLNKLINTFHNSGGHYSSNIFVILVLSRSKVAKFVPSQGLSDSANARAVR